MATEHPASVAEKLRGEIRAEMARQKMTRQSLSDRSGIPTHALDRRLNGQTEISFAEAERLADALGVPYDRLVARVIGSAA